MIKKIIILGSFLLIGCGIQDGDRAPKIGPFQATYFSKSQSKPVASELVDLPSLNYSYNKFHGIDAKEFRAEWAGNIEVYDKEQVVNINFDVSWAEVSLYVNKTLVSSWKNSNKTIPVTLNSGSHSILIKFKNNWHTVGFNTSFESYPNLKKENAYEVVTKEINDNAKIIYIGAYESSNTYNKIYVSMENSKDSVILILSSNNSVDWIIDSSIFSNIAGIIVSAKSGQSSIRHIDKKIPIYSVKDLENEYKTFLKVKRDIVKITGKDPNYVYGEYSMASVVIPAI